MLVSHNRKISAFKNSLHYFISHFVCCNISFLLLATTNERVYEMAKISRCDYMFSDRIKSGLLYLIHL